MATRSARIAPLPAATACFIAELVWRANPILLDVFNVASLVGPTAFQINAAVDLGGTVYAFTAGRAELPSGQTCTVGGTDQVLTLDLATGDTTFMSNYDPATFFVTGAARRLHRQGD